MDDFISLWIASVWNSGRRLGLSENAAIHAVYYVYAALQQALLQVCRNHTPSMYPRHCRHSERLCMAYI